MNKTRTRAAAAANAKYDMSIPQAGAGYCIFTWAEEGEEEALSPVARANQSTVENIGKGLARTSQSQSTRDRELEVMFRWEQENRNIRNLMSILFTYVTSRANRGRILAIGKAEVETQYHFNATSFVLRGCTITKVTTHCCHIRLRMLSHTVLSLVLCY
jgi:hypothetical protein